MRIKYKEKSINVDVEKLSIPGMFVGLMFKSKETDILLFNFLYKRRWSIHSLFVFFPFLAIWLDEKDKVIEAEIVKPFSFSISPKKPIKKLIEVPINKKNRNILKLFGKSKGL